METRFRYGVNNSKFNLVDCLVASALLAGCCRLLPTLLLAVWLVADRLLAGRGVCCWMAIGLLALGGWLRRGTPIALFKKALTLEECTLTFLNYTAGGDTPICASLHGVLTFLNDCVLRVVSHQPYFKGNSMFGPFCKRSVHSRSYF